MGCIGHIEASDPLGVWLVLPIAAGLACLAAWFAIGQTSRVRRLVLAAPVGLRVREHPTVDIFSIQLPTDWLETWLPDPRQHLGRRIDGGLGWGLALSAYVRQLSTPIGALPASLVADHLGSLLTLALDREHAQQPMGRDLPARIDEVLAGRCTEPDLCADGVAAVLGLSVRTLHRALASRQQTFADRLMQHRIRRARRMLESPAFDRVTTAEIGRRVGLLDPSHFIRVCRRLSGCTPQELRLRRG